jgi:hypothetical protein
MREPALIGSAAEPRWGAKDRGKYQVAAVTTAPVMRLNIGIANRTNPCSRSEVLAMSHQRDCS